MGSASHTLGCCTAHEQGDINAMDANTTPKRVVLRFKVKHELEERAINDSYFTRIGHEPKNDYYSHLMAANYSSKMHIVLDLHCNTNPIINNREILYEVYSVSKKDAQLYVVLQINVS
jgi:hypothetical protein